MSNPTSFRFPFELPEDVHPQVKNALRYALSGIKDLNDAIVALKAQVPAAAQPTTTPTQIPTAEQHAAAAAAAIKSVAPLHANGIVTTGLALTQSGTSTAINISAGNLLYGFVSVNYLGGTVDPGGYGQYYVYVIDRNYAGGTPNFLVSNNAPDLYADVGVIYLGTITTAIGGGGSGGGPGKGGGGHGVNPN